MGKTKGRLIVARILFVIYLGVVFWLCCGHTGTFDGVPLKIWGIHTDKIVHFIMFFPFAFLSYMSFEKRKNDFWRSLLFIILVVFSGLCVAALTEYLQRFIPGRVCDIEDFYADARSLLISGSIVFLIDLCRNISELCKRKKR